MSNKYQLTEDGVFDLERVASIPADEGNRDWQEFLLWQQGITVDPITLEPIQGEPNTPRPMKPSPFHSWDGSQWVEDTAAKESSEALAALAESDRGMARVLEDLISTLELKGLIAFSDLPQVAQDKLVERDILRGKVV